MPRGFAVMRHLHGIGKRAAMLLGELEIGDAGHDIGAARIRILIAAAAHQEHAP